MAGAGEWRTTLFAVNHTKYELGPTKRREETLLK